MITAPLTSLLKGKPKTLHWNPEAEHAFQMLKTAFVTTPLLQHPDPERKFIVEVEASMTGVGAILSQYPENSSKPMPCAFFSRKLSPAEKNYDIGNRELLAVKLALEEWRHWLEGARHPFLVLTDHKDLQYLKEAKRLNPRQARWALFFTRFHFQIAYRPGSKNTRADTLSRLHAPEETLDKPEPILPTKLFVNPIQWDLDEQIRELSQDLPAPPECPANKIYIPKDLRTPLISSAHSSIGTGHPGINKTCSTLQHKYWWPGMLNDIRTFIQGCTLCAISKVPHQLPSGKLVPLPIPHRPWSHIGIDFVTDLPVSDGNTCILVAIDRFSKACKLIPLKALPPAFDTAKLLFEHVFRNFGIPEDIVSDRGPQFISRVWRAFFSLLNVTISLTSGYHPQTNGQTERKIQDVSRFLRMFCHSNQNLRSHYLVWAEYAQNSLRQASINMTPFQCILGYQPPLFPWSGEPSEVPAVNTWMQDSERVWDQAHHHLNR
uniref:Gypsy retrotransposon integrase-like protein 1 n=1 Tax=Cyprinus carpio TaxID=7962 RepID=A0A8C1GVU0_CYPCA